MPKRPLSEAEASYLRERKLGRLATVDPAGTPHVVPVAYAYADGVLWMSSDPGDLKHRNLVRHPRAALVVDDPPPAKTGVVVRGGADVLEDGDDFERAQDHLRAAGAAPSRRMRPGEQVYVRLVPESVASWRVDR